MDGTTFEYTTSVDENSKVLHGRIGFQKEHLWRLLSKRYRRGKRSMLQLSPLERPPFLKSSGIRLVAPVPTIGASRRSPSVRLGPWWDAPLQRYVMQRLMGAFRPPLGM